MREKSKLLAAGVLSVLVLAALPAVASAGEYEMHCPVAPCVGTVSGSNVEHMIELETDNGERFDVSAIDGTIKIGAATTTTATVELEFTHIYETFTGFRFTCSSIGAPAGVIRTGPITTHFVNLMHGGTKPGVLLTNINVTYTCGGGFSSKTLTGGLIGALTQANCNVAAATNQIAFNSVGGPPRTQEYKQVTGTGTLFDLMSGPHSGASKTWAITAQLNVTWQAGNKPTLTC